MRLGWLWTVVVLGWGCARAFPPLELAKLPTQNDHPDAKYVVLLDETVVEFSPGPSGAPQALITEHRRLKILQPTVLPQLQISYAPSFTEVERVRGRVVKPDGSEEPLDVSKQRDVPAFDQSVLVTDERVVVVPIPPLPIGAVYEEEIVTRRLDVKPWVQRSFFGDEVPVEVSRVVFRAPRDWLIRWSVLSYDGQPFAPVESSEGERKVWTFERTHLAALEQDPQGPPPWARLPSLSARLEEWTERGEKKSAFASPEVLSSWLAGQYATQAQIAPELVTTVKEVLAGVPDEPEAKARALYEHVCRTIQYCAIEIGYGGWIPHASPQVQKLRYGDCKDKATYLHALLKVANVSSAPTLIYAHGGTPRPFQLPSLGANFNHAILAVDLPGGRVVYADPTQRTVPFGELPPSDQGATVLELRPEGAALKRTPESAPSSNLVRQTVTLELDARGDGQGTLKLESTGGHAIPVKNRLVQGTGLLREWFDRQVWLRSAFASDARPVVTGDFAQAVTLEGKLEVRHVLARSSTGEALVRASDLLSPWVSSWATRDSDLVWPMAEMREAIIELALPAGAEVRALPADAKIESPYGEYAVRWRKTERGLAVERTFIRKKRVVPVAGLSDFNAFAWKAVGADYAAAVVKFPLAAEASR